MDETQHAIEEVLAGEPRADELREMIAALEVRRATFLRDRNVATEEAARREWTNRLREVDRQLDLLRREQAITQFVENSVRATVNRPRVELDDEEPGW